MADEKRGKSMRITIEIDDADVLRLLKLVQEGRASNEPKKLTATENTKLSDTNKVKTVNKVEEGEEKVNLEELLSECRASLVSAVKSGKKKDVENLFSKIGITALSNASAGQLVEFKKGMTGIEV